MSERQDGDLRFETVQAPLTVGTVDFGDLREEGWECVLDHKTDGIVAAFPTPVDALTYANQLNEAYGSLVTTQLDIAKRATAVERERCLSEVEALYADWSIVEDPGTVLLVLRTIGERIAGGDAGPHSDAALAWRRRVTGVSDDGRSKESTLGAMS